MTRPDLRVVREPTRLADKINAYARGYDRGRADEADSAPVVVTWLRGPLGTVWAWLRGAP